MGMARTFKARVRSEDRLIAWLGAAPSRRFCMVVFGLYVLHVVTGLAAHAMWRDELQAWLIVRDSATLPELVRNLAYEGHPLAWYLLIWPLHFISRDPMMIQLAQAGCALGAMALLLWRGPFSRIELMLLPLSYPFLFEYAVKSRAYALGILVLFAFCAAFTARRPVLVLAALLAVLINVHAMFGLIALGGLVAIAVRRWQEEGWRRVLQVSDVPAACVFVLGAMLAVAIARPPADSGYAVGWMLDLAPEHVDQTMLGLRALLAGWANWGWLAQAAPYLSLMLMALVLIRVRRAPAAGCFFVVAAGLLVVFMHAKGVIAPWHGSLLFIALVAAVWLARGREGPAGPALVPRAVLVLVLVVQALTGLRVARVDRIQPYSAARETARLLTEAGLGSAPIFARSGVMASPVVAYLGAPAAFYGNGMREGSFVVWDKAWRAPVNVAALVDRAEAVPGAVVLDCRDKMPEGPPPDPRLVEWRRVPGSMEACVIYRIRQ